MSRELGNPWAKSRAGAHAQLFSVTRAAVQLWRCVTCRAWLAGGRVCRGGPLGNSGSSSPDRFHHRVALGDGILALGRGARVRRSLRRPRGRGPTVPRPAGDDRFQLQRDGDGVLRPGGRHLGQQGLVERLEPSLGHVGAGQPTLRKGGGLGGRAQAKRRARSPTASHEASTPSRTGPSSHRRPRRWPARGSCTSACRSPARSG